jgi:hypothetical protein
MFEFINTSSVVVIVVLVLMIEVEIRVRVTALVGGGVVDFGAGV